MAELATIARPYAEALFKAFSSDLGGAAVWLDELAAILPELRRRQSGRFFPAAGRRSMK